MLDGGRGHVLSEQIRCNHWNQPVCGQLRDFCERTVRLFKDKAIENLEGDMFKNILLFLSDRRNDHLTDPYWSITMPEQLSSDY